MTTNTESERFEFEEADVISMILDTNTGCLYLQKNNNEKVLFLMNLSIGSEIRYKMAISLKNKTNCVS